MLTALVALSLLAFGADATPSSKANLAPGQLKVGVATRVVNPTKPAATCGSQVLVPLDKLYSDICTQAVVLQDENAGWIVLISCDFMMIPHEVADEIRQAIREKHGIEPEAVCVHSTHNHSAPPLVLREAMKPELFDPQYVAFFIRETLAAVDEAIARLTPVRLRYCEDLCTSVAINRRGPGPDGRIQSITPNNTGIVDYTVRVVVAEPPAGGKPLMILAQYAAHPVVTYFRLGGEYPGYMRQSLKQKFPDSTPVFLQGCAGNIRIQILNDDRTGWIGWDEGTPEMARRFGFDLADAVERALCKPGTSIAGPIEARYTEIQVPLAGPAAGKTWPFRIQAFRLGDNIKTPFTLIGLGAEPFIEYGLQLQKRLKPANTMVIGYANGMAAYLPTAKALEEGGYEPNAWYENWYALPGPYATEAEIVVLDAAQQLAKPK